MTTRNPPTSPAADRTAQSSAAKRPAPPVPWAPWAVMLAGAVLSLALVLDIPDEVFFSGDGGLKALLAKQFAAGRWEGDLRLPAEPWVRDLWDKGAYPFAPPFVYQLEGRHYAAFPITFPLATAPFYAWFGYRGLYVLPLAGLWLTWLQFHALARRFNLTAGEATLSMATLVLASPLTLYGAMYWEHTLAVALAFGGIAATLHSTGAQRAVSRHLFGGALLGLSVWLRPECLCVAAAVVAACFVFSRRDGSLRPWGAFTAATAVMVAAFVLLNSLLYGNPLGVHALQVTEGFDLAGHVVQAATFCLRLNAQLLVYLPVVVFILLVILLPAFSRPGRLTPTVSYLLTVLVLASVAIPLIVPHTGGRSWGPRFLLCSVPVAALAAGLLLHECRQEAPRWKGFAALVIFAAALLGGAILNTGWGTRKLHHNYATRVLPALNFLRNSDHDVVVISHQWVAQELQALFGQKHFLRVDEPADVAPLAGALGRQGYDGFVFLWARYDDSPPQQRVQFDGPQVTVAGPLVRQLGENFFAYDCAILDRQ